jgi:hypothetical protein
VRDRNAVQKAIGSLPADSTSSTRERSKIGTR